MPLRIATWTVATDSGYHAGVVGVARPLNQQWVREMKVGVDMALIVGDSVIATTLPDSLVQVLATLDLPTVWEQQGVMLRHVEQLRYLYSPWPITDGEVPAGILLLRPVAQELALAQSIFRSVVGIGAVALLLALALAFVVSRIVARPAQTLAAAAAELAHGQLRCTPSRTRPDDEVGQLTTAFGEMRSAIAEREGSAAGGPGRADPSGEARRYGSAGRRSFRTRSTIPSTTSRTAWRCWTAVATRDDPNREFLSLAREELERMAVLTRQLLDQSRPLSDAARPLDLNQVVTRVLTLASGELEENRVTVTLDLDSELPLVVAHPDAMQQVMANLVANAIDAMPDGGELAVRTSADETVVEVSVTDTGAGNRRRAPSAHLRGVLYDQARRQRRRARSLRLRGDRPGAPRRAAGGESARNRHALRDAPAAGNARWQLDRVGIRRDTRDGVEELAHAAVPMAPHRTSAGARSRQAGSTDRLTATDFDGS